MRKISIVTPMYNESPMVHLFLQTVDGVLKNLKNYDYEIVCVNDGSKDDTLALLKKEQETNDKLVIVDLSRNWGQESAVRAGLLTATGDAVIPMDADLQDPPELIPELIAKWEEGYEVVNAKRCSRKKDTAFKRNTAGIYYRILDKLSPKVKIPQNVNNFRLLDRVVVDTINALPEKNRVLRIEIPFVGFKVCQVEFVRQARAKGESHYPLKAMINLATSSLTSISTKPLSWSLTITLVLGFLFTLSGLTELVLFILQKCNVCNFMSPMSYWGWLIINIVLLFTIILSSLLTIISLYMAKVVEESQGRPNVIIREVIKK